MCYVNEHVGDMSSSSSRTYPELEHSCFHEVLPMFSVLSVFPCWVEVKVVMLEICIQGRGRLLSLGNPRIDTLGVLVMSSDISILATCSTNQSHLVWLSWDSCGGEPARSRTMTFVTWSVYGMQKIPHKQILSEASILSCKPRVMAHVSELNNTRKPS